MLEIALSGSQAVKSQYNCLVTDRSGLYRQYQGGTPGWEAGRGYYRIRIRSNFAQHEIQLFLQITFSPHLCYRLSTSHLDIRYHQHFRRLKAMDEIDNETFPPLSSHLSGTIYYYTNIVRQGLM